MLFKDPKIGDLVLLYADKTQEGRIEKVTPLTVSVSSGRFGGVFSRETGIRVWRKHGRIGDTIEPWDATSPKRIEYDRLEREHDDRITRLKDIKWGHFLPEKIQEAVVILEKLGVLEPLKAKKK